LLYSLDKVSLLLILPILIVFLGAQIFLRSFGIGDPKLRIHPNLQIYPNDTSKIYKHLFFGAVILTFSYLVFQSFQQYWAWAGNELSKNLLPPYQTNYFIFYVFTRFFAPYLISLAAALVFLFSAKILNKKYEERFFYPEEIYLGASAIFLSGHPGWLFYVVFLLVVYVLVQLFFVAKYSILNTQYSSPRLSLYWLWIPVAIIVIILMNWLKTLPWWNLLKI